MPLEEVMRQLQFYANHKEHSQVDQASDATQKYVTSLLSSKLLDYGFHTNEDQSLDRVEIHVEDHPVALSVQCDQADEQGHLVCRIHAHADEDQPWFTKIETQSVIKQLAHAIENTLKDDDSFSEFEWKG